jgi:glucosamine--fructose-6-phosphate aminotransferase (isomerizing)
VSLLSDLCELFIASNATALVDETNRTIILEDWDLVHISPNGVDIVNISPKIAFSSSRIVETLNISIQDIARDDDPHFMLKKIMEQPSTIAPTIRGRLTPDDASVHFGMLRCVDTVRKARSILFIACGTSYNVPLAVRPLFEKYTRQRIFVEVSSDSKTASRLSSATTAASSSRSRGRPRTRLSRSSSASGST